MLSTLCPVGNDIGDKHRGVPDDGSKSVRRRAEEPQARLVRSPSAAPDLPLWPGSVAREGGLERERK
jgi:hypothetical protein